MSLQITLVKKYLIKINSNLIPKSKIITGNPAIIQVICTLDIMASPRDRRPERDQGSSTSFPKEKETTDRAVLLSFALSSSPFPPFPPLSSFLS